MFSVYRLFARIFPRNIKESIRKLLEYSNIEVDVNRFMGFQLLFSFLLSVIVAFYAWIFLKYSIWIVFGVFFVSTQAFVYMWLLLSADKKGRFIESVLPDALQLMSSNLRTGVTIDKALFMAARPEFGPFKKELDRVGKEVAVGKDLVKSLKDLSLRIKSAKLEKTVYLIVSGIRSGGDLAPLLEKTAQDLRNQEIMDKKIRASIDMYKIFIFIAIGLAAPFLFALSSIVVEVLTKSFAGVEMPKSTIMPIAFGGMSMSIGFVKTFSLVFISTNCILGSLVLGLISKGKAKEGAKYIIPLIFLSVGVFFAVRILMSGAMAGLFGF